MYWVQIELGASTVTKRAMPLSLDASQLLVNLLLKLQSPEHCTSCSLVEPSPILIAS